MIQKSAKKLSELLLDSSTEQVINQFSFHSTEVCKYFLFTCLHVHLKINNFIYVTVNHHSPSKVGNTRNTHDSKSHCCGSQFNGVTMRLLSFILDWLTEGLRQPKVWVFFSFFFPLWSLYLYLCKSTYDLQLWWWFLWWLLI